MNIINVVYYLHLTYPNISLIREHIFKARGHRGSDKRGSTVDLVTSEWLLTVTRLHWLQVVSWLQLGHMWLWLQWLGWLHWNTGNHDP